MLVARRQDRDHDDDDYERRRRRRDDDDDARDRRGIVIIQSSRILSFIECMNIEYMVDMLLSVLSCAIAAVLQHAACLKLC